MGDLLEEGDFVSMVTINDAVCQSGRDKTLLILTEMRRWKMEQKINFAWPVTSSSKEEYVAFCEWMTAHKTMLESNEIAIWGSRNSRN